MPERPTDFAEFFAARRSALSRAAYFLSGSQQEAEELFQEAMARAYANWSKVGQHEDPEPYIRTIMVNLVRSRWRRASVSERLSHRATSATVTTDHDPGEGIDLQGRLKTLTPGQRAALFFRYYLDFSETQTAEALGCSVGTVKSQTYRALQALRAQDSIGDQTAIQERRR